MAVGVVQGVGDARRQLRRLAKAGPPGLEARRQRLALDELLDEVEQALVGLPRLVQRHQAGVLQPGRAARLAREAVRLLAAGQAAGPEQLDRDGPAQLGVARPKDVAE